jgi:penicillin-binding protein 1A
MPRLTAGVLVIALIATACSVAPIEDPGIGAGSLTTHIYASDGSLLAEWHAGEDRVPVTYADLPTHLVNAVVAIEDRRFWVHSGVDLRALVRASRENYLAGEVVEGGSTITQQYARAVLLDTEVTAERKMREMNLALQIEETLTKEEILERYLNTVYFGEMAYGVGAAARRYFGKHVSQLSLAESALLAGLIVAPSTLNPFDNPHGALTRREVVLGELLDLEWIDVSTAVTAAATPLNLAPRHSADRMRYPHFTAEAKRRLLENPALGSSEEERHRLLTSGGLRVFTTLDPRAQVAAEEAISSVVGPGGPSVALVAIDPRSGHVISLVGGLDFYDENDPIAQFNLATQGLRQPGSAFKIFAMAAALDAGFELDSSWPGGRSISIRTGDDVWEVRNHEDAFFPGLSLAEATVFSVNVPYAHIVDRIGSEAIIAAAHDAGIRSHLDPVPSVVLGTQPVSPFEMASAYATFANDGLRVDPVFVTRIEAPDGTVLYEHVPTFTRVFDSVVAEQVTATLMEAVRRGTGQHARIGRPVAGKTGSTEANFDAWFVGYTPEMAASVWVGYAEGDRALVAPHTPYTVTGGTWPAQIWARFAMAALSGVAFSGGGTAQAVLDGLITVSVDLSTGFLAGPLCPRATVADLRLDPSTAPSIVCPIHNPQGLTVANDGTVPAVTSFSTLDAVTLLESAGYRVAISWDLSAPESPGTVAYQHPVAGTLAAPGSQVAITIAGPEPGTIIPGVVGRTLGEAVLALESLGQEVRVIMSDDPDHPDLASGIVWAQGPDAGSKVSGAVTIWVAP